MTKEPSSASLCRLCTHKIKDTPVRISSATASSCSKVHIIQRHFNIEVFGLGTNADDEAAFVCPNCWTTTEQFHQLYVTVQQHEAALVRHAQASCRIPTPSSADIKAEHTKCSSTSPVQLPLFECKVEIQDGDTAAFDLYPESLPPCSPSRSSTTSSTSSTSTSPIPRNKSKKPALRKSKTPKAAKRSPDDGVATKRPRQQSKWSASEIAEQDARIREFYRMQCELCDTKFEDLGDVSVHYRREHNQPGYLKCCGKKFSRRTLVLDHMQHHNDPNAFHCAICSRSYINQGALNMHMISHDKELPKPYKCDVCGADFVKHFQLRQHQRIKHPVTTEKSFGCDICGKFFFTKWQMSSHIQSVHIAAHICDICAHTFKSKFQLKSHYQKVHIGDTKPKVQCNICEAWLTDERCLRRHIDRHQQVAVSCSLCGKVARSKSSLASHMQYVHGGRLFPCTVCDKSFKRAIGLREHLAAHTGVDLYTCTYCPRTFKSNSNMFAHRKKAHPIEWSRDRELRISQ